ncbi:RNA-binding ribosome biosynthesis protein mak21 [Mycoemilia scoparia]|uniref:RNA-binding ribosome biosynthesis protein mak21 n=1 Tax=Mycoemilia scoparia TaxID=417184 RepID=A0A9W7ZXD2_9FUNG|nr:RNA-binding ribosome biosynthesis protein mak21 [Mycoemilia scoparia]
MATFSKNKSKAQTDKGDMKKTKKHAGRKGASNQFVEETDKAKKINSQKGMSKADKLRSDLKELVKEAGVKTGVSQADGLDVGRFEAFPKKLMFKPDPSWHAYSLPELDAEAIVLPPSESYINKMLVISQGLLENEANLRINMKGEKNLSSSDQAFISNIINSGTLSDKVSGLTLLVQESPLHAFKHFELLMNMARKNSRREALLAISSIKDLMVSSLLPDRKLRFFADQPIMHPQVTQKHLVYWYFENQLKKNYFELIQLIEALAYDSVIHVKHNMLVFIETLLETKPEQEQNLLRLLVTKLGDKEKQVASKASYLLLKLLNVHPNMKQVVVKTVQELHLTRNVPHQRSLYYTMVTINQIVLSSKDTQTANLLIELYFTFFRKIFFPTGNNQETKNDDKDDDSGNEIKKKSGPPKKNYHGQKFMKKAKEQAALEQKLELRSLDNKLMAAILSGVNRALPFSKISKEELDKHTDVLFKVVHSANFNSIVQALALLYQVSQKHESIVDRVYRALYGSLLDSRIETTSKQAMYLNILFKALNSDNNQVRVLAFVKRMLQIASSHQPSFVCGLLYMISKVTESKPIIMSYLARADEPLDEQGAEEDVSQEYDFMKRDPRFAKAEQTCCWELSILMHHFHPSVSRLTKKILDGEKVEEATNLHLHSLSHFLERFVYRNPKLKEGTQYRGQSLMQPIIDTRNMHSEIISKKPVGITETRKFDPEAIASMSIDEVPEDIRFFHRFFSIKKEQGIFDRNKKSKSRAHGGDFDDDQVDIVIDKDAVAEDSTGFTAALAGHKTHFGDDDMDEDEAWKAMEKSMPDDLKDGLGSDDDDSDGFPGFDSDSDEISGNENEAFSDFEDKDSDMSDMSSDVSSEGDHGDFSSVDDQELSGSDEEPEKPGKRPRDDVDSSNKKSRKREKLPMFASFEDYEHLINSNEGLT